MQELLLLDSAIRDWVVLPMVLIVLLVGVGRHYVQELIKTTPFYTEQDVAEFRCKQIIQKAARLRMNGQFLTSASYQKRKAYLIRKKVGLLREKTPAVANPMSNPMAMMDMMKGNLTFMIPNFAMMGFVSNFFTGFVCLKVPFSLPSSRFRLMLQRGVDLNTLDVSYVSSLSWYFLVTFGMNGVYKLILGGDVDLDDTKMMQQQVYLFYFLIFKLIFYFIIFYYFRWVWVWVDLVKWALMPVLLIKMKGKPWELFLMNGLLIDQKKNYWEIIIQI